MPRSSRRSLLTTGVAAGLAALSGFTGILGSDSGVNEDWSNHVSRRSGGITAHDGSVYIGTAEGLETLDTETGDEGWAFSTQGKKVSSFPVVTDGPVFFGTFSGPSEPPTLYGVTAAGEEHWSAPLPDAGGITTPAITGGTVFAGTGVMGGDYRVVAHDATTGDEEWSVALGSHAIGSSPTASKGRVYIESGGFAAFDADSGDNIWRHETGTTEIGESPYHSPTVGDETVYFSDSTEPEVYALDTATGEKQWMTTVNARPTQSVLDGDTLYVGTTNFSLDDPEGRLYALDTTTGDIRWSVTTGDVPLGGPDVRSGTVYTAGSSTLCAIEDGETAWTHEFENGISAPVVAGDRLIVSDFETVYSLS